MVYKMVSIPNKLLKWIAFFDFGLLTSIAFIESLDLWVRIAGGIVGIILAGFLIWQTLSQKRLTDIDYEIKKRELEIKDHELYERMHKAKQLPEKRKKVKRKS